VVFVAAMLAGMWLARFIANRPGLADIARPADRIGA
jgi:hypothetical protein